jgi:hypothetical protein
MNPAVARIRPGDLDALWGRSDPDLELDQDGRIRPVTAPSVEPSRGSALGSAAPVALGAIVSTVSRWD